jgi:hypothetical protein
MAILKIDLNPERQTLRVFALICMVALGLLGTWVRYRHSFLFFEFDADAAESLSVISWGFGTICGVLGLIAPGGLRQIYVGLTLAVLPIGLVISYVVVGTLFFCVLAPVGLLRGILGRDSLTRKLDPERTSYWHEKEPVGDVARYYRLY